MIALNCRRWIWAALFVLTAGSVTLAPAGQPSPVNPLGLFVVLAADPDAALQQVTDAGLKCAEVYTEDFSPAAETALRAATRKHGVEITALFTMGPGPQAWDFENAPSLNGLLPREWRRPRLDRLKQASDFARRLGIRALETHVGFVPENPKDPLYRELVEAVREAVQHCRSNEQTFLYHAGAETAVALLRILTDVGWDNQGVGLDTANSILYGTGNPVDALEIYGSWVRAVNAKDGLFPTDAKHLGKETPLGQGRVDFPKLIRKLRELNYRGPIIIEREIRGPEFVADVRQARAYLEKLLQP